MNEPIFIAPQDRSWAIIAHLSGLAGYLIPLGGVIAPIILIFMKRDDSPVVGSIAKQALYLNIFVFVTTLVVGAVCFFLVLTVIGIPLAFVLGALSGIPLTLVALGLPIIGAVKASSGEYFSYPIVGQRPYLGESHQANPVEDI